MLQVPFSLTIVLFMFDGLMLILGFLWKNITGLW